MDIEVYRPKQFGDMTRHYKLLADGVEIGLLKRGETQTINIPDNTEALRATIDWCSSQEFLMSELRERKLTVKNSFSGNFFKSLLLSLYYITIGKNKYLKIESGI
jgi:hypothetical protein